VKLSLEQAMEVHRVVRRRGSQILYTIDSDGAEVFSVTHRPPFNSQEDSWFSFVEG
jgi:hypothetical protein